jgi:NADPH:quinone reductase-like Zn-dependent oxidoreductase
MDDAQAEYCMTVPANIAPQSVTLEHAHAAAVSAWQALVDRAHLGRARAGIHSAAGGVGTFAVQLPGIK